MVEGNLFVYGSLRCPEVLDVLLGRVPTLTPANVVGWRPARLRNRIYPALIPARGTTTGAVISGLSRNEWRILNSFEDEIYDLEELRLTDARFAWAYVCFDDALCSGENWDIERFVSTELEAYVTRCRAWRDRYDEQGS